MARVCGLSGACSRGPEFAPVAPVARAAVSVNICSQNMFRQRLFALIKPHSPTKGHTDQ